MQKEKDSSVRISYNVLHLIKVESFRDQINRTRYSQIEAKQSGYELKE